MRSFNSSQREGLAKVADNLATASLVTGIVSGFVDQKLVWWQLAALALFFCSLMLASLWLRRTEGGEDE